jgi:sarcosine oxidase, subunit alpha
MSASGPFRLPEGGRVDRGRTVSFTFNGRRLTGFAGDTLSGALLANGVRIVARSFKYHRPRGLLSAGIEEPNALLRVEINGCAMPLVRATLQPLVEGMAVRSENCYPTLGFDIGRVVDYTRALWPAGFYNKTFKWPRWETFEPFIRRAAGLGTLPTGRDAGAYYHHNIHCDVLVVGGGVAGIAAALAAARTGVDVVLIEQERELGGRLFAERNRNDGMMQWLEAAANELAQMATARVLTRTLVAGYYDHNVLTAVDQSDADHVQGRVERFWCIRAQEVVLATGAIEQPLLFGGNDRPGIMLAGAVRAYLNRFAVAVGRNVVIATNNDDAYQTAFDLHDRGMSVAAIIDVRPDAGPAIAQGVSERRLAVHRSSGIVSTFGSPAVTAVSIATLATPSARTGARTRIECDAVAMSAGWNPTVHLYSQAGGTVKYDSGLACFVPECCRQRVRIVGAANAEFSITAGLESGTRAGHEAAAASRGESPPAAVTMDYRRDSFSIKPVRRTAIGVASRQWVDFQHDVTVADIELAVRENYVSIEHLKRYTTNGMSVDQGKTSNLNAIELLAEFSGRSPTEVGTTTFRPQFAPVSLGAIAGGAQGELYAPARHLPAHAWHVSQAAFMDDYGGWTRPAYYASSGAPRERAIEQEVVAARNQLALFDGSPLGKIEVRGRDAAVFLDRMYVNNALSLEPGKVRYGLMLNENGIVIDDGVFARLSDEHYLLSTTGANADRIAIWLDEWSQCEWPELEVIIVPVTTEWAVLTLAGARSRSLLQQLPSDIDFSAAAFPHMSIRTGHLCGNCTRVQRVSFSGELSYEISVPASHATALYEQLTTRGAQFGLRPVGVESWLVLRLEKGFLHVGSDTDGTTNALDVGFGPLIDKKSGDFVGRRSLRRAHDQRETRRQLVGLEPIEPGGVLRAGAHVTSSGRNGERRSEGFITSATFSPSLGRSIGLGLLERGRNRLGEAVTVFDAGQETRARIVSPSFFDPTGERMRA